MGRPRQRFRPEIDAQGRGLERRELLSQGVTPVVTAVVDPSQTGERNLFHQNGINGLVMHRTFVNQLNDRLVISQDRSQRVIQAFEVFQTAFQQLPVNPPAGYTGPTLASLVNTLKSQVQVGEIRREFLNGYRTPSEATSIIYSPQAPVALVPFSFDQIDTMAATLEALPPVSGPNGTMVQGDSAPAVNQAVNAIVNAIAEFTLHPNLFTSTSDFYLNPYVTFTTSFTGVPASSAPGYFIRGPHGTILPGATLHPHAPN